ncbi:anaphase-promoting complex subunit 1-like [Durio zibethinus]|uniref:Anaphase-promoting complex subunit 1-like n=1 Tax=Durio zibethinus TaxID=66656 RepID=A0A6P6AHH5_DURZI|nr:anaphase-promoting complex subunit 1-like [Durio zibethinus]
MPVGVRQLTVLGEFKPLGLIAEALDGQPPDNLPDNCDYFLFDPEVTRQRDENLDNDVSASALSDRRDHELFIRGNRIIWSIRSRVFKRFILPSAVIMACRCHMGGVPEALLCVLQIDSLTIYSTSGFFQRKKSYNYLHYNSASIQSEPLNGAFLSSGCITGTLVSTRVWFIHSFYLSLYVEA